MPPSFASFFRNGSDTKLRFAPSLLFGGRFGNPSVFVGVGEGPVSREHFIVRRIQIRFGPAAFPLLVLMIPSTDTSMWCYLLAASRSRCSNALSDMLTSLI